MAAEEGFSFPSINGSSAPNTDSSPLWCLSSAAKESEHGEKKDDGCEKRSYGVHRKSYSWMVDGRRTHERQNDSDEDEGEDEKMDMLWEDFNEELLKNLSSRFGSDGLPENEMVQRLQLECSEPEEAEAGVGGALLSTRTAGMVVIMKVLKKLLFLHSFRRKLKARTWRLEMECVWLLGQSGIKIIEGEWLVQIHLCIKEVIPENCFRMNDS